MGNHARIFRRDIRMSKIVLVLVVALVLESYYRSRAYLVTESGRGFGLRSASMAKWRAPDQNLRGRGR